MNLEEIQLLNKLEKYESDEEILKLLHKVRSTCVDVPGSRTIISDLQRILDNRDVDRYEEKSPYYSIFQAYAHAIPNEIKLAARQADLAVSGFKKLGKEKDWQRAISSWFHGLLLCEQEQYDSAKAKIDKAIKLISELAKEKKRLGAGGYEESKHMRGVIEVVEANRNQIEELRVSAPKNNPTINVTKELADQDQKKKVLPKSSANIPLERKQDSNYISIPWLPIFQSVSAGPNGIVIMDAPSTADVTLSVIDIYDVPYDIYPIKKMDYQVTLNHVFTYGLVKVEGNNMSNSQPININNSDYVLFSKQQNPEDNDIVIASRKTSSGDFVYTINRYKKKEELLISESLDKDNSDEYLPIKFSQNYQILGVVIAVAKQTSQGDKNGIAE
jgi:hypothetical protein